MSFTVIDWIFSVLIVLLAFNGLFKGFIENVFGKLALILGILFACMFYKKAVESLFKGINNPTLQNILAFLLVFVVVFLLVKILQMIIGKLFSWQPLKSLDRTLGFCFGIVEGLAVVWLIIFLLTIQPFFNADSLISGSFFAGLINSFLSGNNTDIYIQEVISNV